MWVRVRVTYIALITAEISCTRSRNSFVRVSAWGTLSFFRYIWDGIERTTYDARPNGLNCTAVPELRICTDVLTIDSTSLVNIFHPLRGGYNRFFHDRQRVNFDRPRRDYLNIPIKLPVCLPVCLSVC